MKKTIGKKIGIGNFCDKPGKHRVSDHLYLVVSKDGRHRSWLLICRVHGQNLQVGLGSARVLSAAEAKEKAALWYALFLKGEDPRQRLKPKEVLEAPAPEENIVRFRAIVKPAIDLRQKLEGWRNPKTRKRWEAIIDTYAMPMFADVPVAQITATDILNCLSKIWFEKTETAVKLQRMLCHVFAVAKSEGLYTGENPAMWEGNLSLKLPSKSKIHKTKHCAAPSLDQIRAMMKASQLDTHYGSLCTQFGALTACRVNEFCRARWEEIDLKEKIWSIPPEHRKDGVNEPHRVPLSRQAVALLK